MAIICTVPPAPTLNKNSAFCSYGVLPTLRVTRTTHSTYLLVSVIQTKRVIYVGHRRYFYLLLKLTIF